MTRRNESLMAEFKVQIVTREKSVFADTAVSVIVPGAVGYFGVLANHAPLVSTLGSGVVTIKKADGSERTFTVSGGIAEVFRNTLTIFPDRME
jgi:F-type H+-transporting ATPase subunit epsilon